MAKFFTMAISSSPHIRSNESTQTIMRDVLIALVPALIGACWFFGFRALTLSLVSIGAGFDFSRVKEKVGAATVAALFKVAIIPLVMICLAIAMGYRGMFLGLVLVVFGSPTAVSSYIMAKNMNSDHDLAAQILMLSTLFSLGTVFLGLFLLKSLNFL